eukprot:12429516-Karenia_brevis.AAC.1
MDRILGELLGDEQVKMLLTQLPATSAGQKRDNSELDRLREENKRLRSASASSWQNNFGKGKSAGKGKKGTGKQGKGGNTPMPRELIDMGCVPSINGQRLCYSYNMQKGCQNNVKDGECQNGAHKCAKRGCGGNHPATACKR